MEVLLSKKVRDKYYDGEQYDRNVINEKDKEVVRAALVEGLAEQIKEYEKRLAKLEAKIFVYESVIKKSNFAAISDKQEGKEDDSR